jgi:hypothetical protein
MNGTACQQPLAMEGPEALRELHRLFLDFMHQLGQERGRRYLWLEDFSDFVAWWRDLPPAGRQQMERDFRRGYTAVVAEGERQIAAALARRDEPGGLAG